MCCFSLNIVPDNDAAAYLFILNYCLMVVHAMKCPISISNQKKTFYS